MDLPQMLKKENIPGLKYKFVELTINGKNKGIYAIEEHFDKILVESNKYREGPILKFSEEHLWDPTLKNRTSYINDNDIQDTNILPFQEKKINSNEVLKYQYEKGKSLLQEYIRGNISTSDAFDSKSLAKFLAISDITGSNHALYFHNLRFYYNPIISRLIPIGYDGTPPYEGSKLLRNISIESNILDFFNDSEFSEEYYKTLKRIAQKEYLDEFLNTIKTQLDSNMDILHKSYPYIRFNGDYIYQNIKFINEKIKHKDSINVNIKKVNNSSLQLDVSNNQLFPVKIIGINSVNKYFDLTSENIYISRKSPYKYKHYQSFKIKIGNEDIDSIIENINFSTIEYKILGGEKVYSVGLSNYNATEENILSTVALRLKDNIKEFDFIKSVDNVFYIKKGKWDINKPLILPKNGKLVVQAGVELVLKNNSYILSRIPLKFIGSEQNPIIISSSGNGQGLFVINTEEESILKNVSFNSLTAPSTQGWSLTGAVTFYQAPVLIENFNFFNSKSEDSLNIFRTKFKIIDSYFKDSKSDAIDLDFSEGLLKNIKMTNIGNDGLDLSGSNVFLSLMEIEGVGDKAISVGEKSQLVGKNINIKNSRIGIASKDQSNVEANAINIKNTSIGYALYQKKPEFGPAYLKIMNQSLDNVEKKYLQDRFSLLNIDGQIFSSNILKVDETDLLD